MTVPRIRSAGRLLVLVALALLLLIPLSMVRGLVTERQSRADDVHREIREKWGEDQSLQPPILSVPFIRNTPLKDGSIQHEEAWIRIFPESLSVDAELETQVRKRSLFEVPVYTASMDFDGVWNLDEIVRAAPGSDWVAQWERAAVSVDPGQARSLARTPVLEIDKKKILLAATRPDGAVENCRLHTELPLEATSERKVAFRLQLVQRGSDRIDFLPAAGSTRVRIRSDWASPSFQGSFLPDQSTITATGFDAEWNVSSLNLDFPTTWRDGAAPHPHISSEESSQYATPQDRGATLAVSLLEPVDDYDSIDRSLKYGSLIVGLSFLALFLFEAFLDRPLHPIQYGLIGLALALFYLLALSLSEHIGFDLAYSISASVVTGLVTGYAASALAGWGRGLILGGGLAVLWGFLYTLLKAEDWALLMGSTGLFLILALVMWLTRRIDWNRREAQEVTP